MEREHDYSPIKTLPKIELPPYIPATPEELARRRAVAEVVDRLREEIGPIGVDVAEWIREDRERDD